MYDRKKLTIKGRFSDVCFRQKMLSRPKDRSFTPPENLPGEGLKFIREKWRFSAFGQNASWAQIYPQNEKTDQKTGRWRILKMVEQKGVEPSTYTMRTYRSSQLSYCPVFIRQKNNIAGFRINSSCFEEKCCFSHTIFPPLWAGTAHFRHGYKSFR